MWRHLRKRFIACSVKFVPLPGAPGPRKKFLWTRVEMIMILKSKFYWALSFETFRSLDDDDMETPKQNHQKSWDSLQLKRILPDDFRLILGTAEASIPISVVTTTRLLGVLLCFALCELTKRCSWSVFQRFYRSGLDYSNWKSSKFRRRMARKCDSHSWVFWISLNSNKLYVYEFKGWMLVECCNLHGRRCKQRQQKPFSESSFITFVVRH